MPTLEVPGGPFVRRVPFLLPRSFVDALKFAPSLSVVLGRCFPSRMLFQHKDLSRASPSLLLLSAIQMSPRLFSYPLYALRSAASLRLFFSSLNMLRSHIASHVTSVLLILISTRFAPHLCTNAPRSYSPGRYRHGASCFCYTVSTL